MDDFVNVIKKDPKVQLKTKGMLDKDNRLSLIYQSKVEYDTLIQKVILIELMNVMGTTITDLVVEIKMEIIRIECLESKNSYNCKYMYI